MVLVAGLAGGARVAQAQAEATREPAQPPQLSDARAAIGIEGEIRSLVLRGTRLAGFNGVTAEPMNLPKVVELRILLPDNFVMIESSNTSVSRKGFVGQQPFHELELLRTSEIRAATLDPARPALAAFRADLVRLLLGIVADAGGVLAIDVSPSIALDETAKSLTVTGTDDFRATLELDRRTSLPRRLRYTSIVQYPGRPLTREERLSGRRPPPKREEAQVVLAFEDWRAVDGLRLPHLITRTAVGRRFEEIRIDEIIVNARLTAADFVHR